LVDINTIAELFTFFGNLGYHGIFIISFIGSIIVFIPIPYFPILIGAAFSKHLDPNLISLSSAAGAVTAKIIIFYASYYGSKIINTNTKNRMAPVQRLLRKYGWLGAFLAALTPIPDDLVYIPLGITKYSPWRFACATFSGKFVLNEIVVWGAVILGTPFMKYFVSSSSSIRTDPVYLVVAVASGTAILGVILYLFLKADWGKIIGRWFPWTTIEEDESRE
jgi:membrane protein DedA with SNARE-associated domain